VSTDGDKWIESLRKGVAAFDADDLSGMPGPERGLIQNARDLLAEYDRAVAKAAPPAGPNTLDKEPAMAGPNDPVDDTDEVDDGLEECEECEGNGWVDDPSDGGTMTCPSCDGDGRVEREE
jgi:hypothetical protein